MSSNFGGDGGDAFDWNAWGAASSSDDGSNGMGRRSSFDGTGHQDADEALEPGVPRPREGRWISRGGVMRWETPDDEDEEAETNPRAEAGSRWADDDLTLPPGAPDTIRLRSVHAWLSRQRALESEAQGLLLLERRRMQGAEEDEHERQRRGSAQTEASPLDVALAEHQAAIDEYERLIEALDDIAAHSGPARVLVEYHLYLTERLAELARAPEAPEEFVERLLLVPVEDEEGASETRAPVTPLSEAEWRGRAEAVAAARRRVERMSAPEPED